MATQRQAGDCLKHTDQRDSCDRRGARDQCSGAWRRPSLDGKRVGKFLAKVMKAFRLYQASTTADTMKLPAATSRARNGAAPSEVTTIAPSALTTIDTTTASIAGSVWTP